MYEEQEKYWLPFFYDIKRANGRIPYNFCLGEVQANVGRMQLKILDWMNRRKNHIAARLTEVIRDVPGVRTQHIPDGRTHAYHLYPVLFDGSDFGADGDDFMGIIYHEFGVKTAPHYPPAYRFHIFQEMGYPRELCPQAERVYSQLTNTPMNLSLSDAQVDYMVESIRKTVEKLQRGEKEPVRNYE